MTTEEQNAELIALAYDAIHQMKQFVFIPHDIEDEVVYLRKLNALQTRLLNIIMEVGK